MTNKLIVSGYCWNAVSVKNPRRSLHRRTKGTSRECILFPVSLSVDTRKLIFKKPATSVARGDIRSGQK
jgi:hypothetical protein